MENKNFENTLTNEIKKIIPHITESQLIEAYKTINELQNNANNANNANINAPAHKSTLPTMTECELNTFHTLGSNSTYFENSKRTRGG